jgi:hypothetical protein
MDAVTLYLTRNEGKDDVIRIRCDDDYHSMYEIRYKANDVKTEHKFFMSESDTIHYLKDIFRSLDVDVDPFVHVQVSTLIHPSVMYSVADLGDHDIRTTIMDMIRTSLRTWTHVVTE